MNYSIKQEGVEFVVRDQNDQRHGEYGTEEKAKRRIRDLKRKEAEIEAPEVDPVLAKIEAANDKVIEDEFDIMSTIPADFAESFDRPFRQVGCYPSVSKRSYRR